MVLLLSAFLLNQHIDAPKDESESVIVSDAAAVDLMNRSNDMSFQSQIPDVEGMQHARISRT